MRIGLVSYLCKNRDLSFNVSQIEKAVKRYRKEVDLLCFGEAFLQGFNALSWYYEKDKLIALEQSSEIVKKLCELSLKYKVALLTGYIEKDQDKLYSSCIVIYDGKIVHNYRRISKGWKEYTITDDHYAEGSSVESFNLMGEKFKVALCGDLWDYPERFKTEDLLIWPVYVNFSLEEWQSGVLDEYAQEASLASKNVLMINSLDNETINHGGSFYFRSGKILSSIPFDKEDVLIVEI